MKAKLVLVGLALLAAPSAAPAAEDNGPPAVQVITYYQGMPASAVERTITRRIERWVALAPRMEHIESRTIRGMSVVRVFFQVGTDPTAALKMTNQLAQGALPTLPPNTLPPVVLPYSPAVIMPLGYVTVENRTLDEARLKDMVRIQVRNYLGSIKGCVAPVVLGGKDQAVLISLDPKKMKARELSMLDVVEALKKNNMMVTPGIAYFGGNQLLLDTNMMVEKVRELNDMPLRATKGQPPILLKDVGHVEDTFAPQQELLRVDGRAAVAIPIYAQQGVRPEAVAAAVARATPEIKKLVPAGTTVRFLPLGIDSKGEYEAGSGLLTLGVRVPSGGGIEDTSRRVAELERFLQQHIPEKERTYLLSDIGVEQDWASAYSTNSSSSDATLRLQLSRRRHGSPQEYATRLRKLLKADRRFKDLEVSILAGYRAEPAITVQLIGGTEEQRHQTAQDVARRIRQVPGAVDVLVQPRGNVPGLEVKLDRARIAAQGMSAEEVLRQVEAALTVRLPHALSERRLDSLEKQEIVIFTGVATDEKTRKELGAQVVTGKDKKKVRLGWLLTVRPVTVPSRIDRYEQSPFCGVSLNAENNEVTKVDAAVERALSDVKRPPGITFKIRRTAR